jgi:hypothetical protein
VIQLLKSVGSARSELNLYDRILVADTWRLLGDPAKATAILTELVDHVAVDPTDRGTIVSAAGVLALGAALERENPRWTRLARHVAAARQGTSWGDTLTTSAAVRGLAAVMSASRQKQIPVVVRADGQQVGVLTGKKSERVDLKVDTAPTISFHPAEPGSGDYYAIKLRGYLVEPPKNPAKPVGRIRSRVFVLQPKRREISADERGRVEVPHGKTLQIQIDVDLQQPISHARLGIPRPCGVELVRAPRSFDGVVATEQHDDALHFFVEHWNEGRHQLDFLVRAEVTGTISSPLPELVPMYDSMPPTAVFGPTQWTVR